MGYHNICQTNIYQRDVLDSRSEKFSKEIMSKKCLNDNLNDCNKLNRCDTKKKDDTGDEQTNLVHNSHNTMNDSNNEGKIYNIMCDSNSKYLF
jgi:hypothetical protein